MRMCLSLRRHARRGCTSVGRFRAFCGDAVQSASASACRKLMFSSVEHTKALASALSSRCTAGDAIFLNGDFGSGKTEWARAFIRSRTGMPELEVVSPSFILDMTYTNKDLSIHHMDLYRLKSEHEIGVLEIDRALKHGVCLIEWPEKLGSHSPESRLEICFDDDISLIKNNDEPKPIDDENHRLVTIRAFGDRWNELLDDAQFVAELPGQHLQ